MSQGKGRDYRYQSLESAIGDDQTQQKQQMIDATQNVFDPEHDEAGGGLVPWRIQGHAAGPGDQHRSAGFAEGQVAHSQLRVIAQVSGDF